MDQAAISAHNAELDRRFGEARLAMANDPVPDPYEVRVVREVEYACPDGHSLLLDLHLPARPSGPVPAIIWVHGGAWMVGDRSFAPDLDIHFAARGYAMLTIEYRLSGDFKFPASLEDVRSAVRWARANATEYGLDPSAIGLWGSSAGAHLATLTATSARDDADRVQAVVDGYGPTDLARADEQRREGDSIHAAVDSPDAKFLGTPLSQTPQTILDAVNPITHITPAAPPFLIFHGTNDMMVPSGQSVILHEALVAAGVESTLCLVEGADHGFFNGHYLDRRPGPAIEMRTNAGGQERSGPGPALSFELIERFFDHHLRSDPWAR